METSLKNVLRPLLRALFKPYSLFCLSFFSQGTWDASQWVHFSLTSCQEEGQMLPQMNTSWTGLCIVLGRKLPVFSGKFFSFLDQRIGSLAILWYILIIKHKSKLIHSELLVQRILSLKSDCLSMTSLGDNIKKKTIPSLSLQGVVMNKRRI